MSKSLYRGGLAKPGTGGGWHLPGPSHTLVRRWYHDPRWRLAAAAILGIATFFIAHTFPLWDFINSALLAWAVTAMAYCLATTFAIGSMNPEETAAHSLHEAPKGFALHVLLLGAAFAALVGVAVLLLRPNSNPVQSAIVTLLTVASSWTVVQVIYILRYAREYYLREKKGIEFNMEGEPQYSDFAYIAYTIGMTFQTSDTGFNNSQMRRIALGHALLTYIFGTIFLASIINVLASLGST